MNKDEAPASPKDAALRLALEDLEHFEKAGLATLRTIDAIIAIKKVLAQPVATNDTLQKPVDETAKQRHEPKLVAWVNLNALSEQINSVNCGTVYRLPCEKEGRQPLYTFPPKSEWQGLTDDERSYYLQTASNIGWWKASEIIEAKLKEKNT